MSLIHEFRRTGQTTRTIPQTSPLTQLSEFQNSSQINGGFASASGTISATEYNANPTMYQIGTTWLVKDTVTSEYIWAGELQDPQPNGDGSYTITADGFGALSDKLVEHFLIMSYNLESWVAGNQDPLSYQNNDKFNLKVGHQHVSWVIKKQTPFKKNNANNPSSWMSGVYKWVPGVDLRYIAFSISISHAMADYTLQVVRGTGPGGALTVAASWTLDGSQPANVTQSIVAGNDLVGIRIVRSTQTKHAPRRQIIISNIRVGAAATSDTYDIEDAMTLLLTKMGAATLDVQTSSVSAIPYEADAGSLGQIADEIAMLDNWHWRMDVHPSTGARKGYAGAFGRKQWKVSRTNSPVVLIPKQRYTHIQFSYIGAGGTIQTKTIAATSNTLPAGVTRTYILDWTDPPHLTIGQLFAQKVVDYLNTIREAGHASFTHVLDPNAADAEVQGTKVRTGDQLILVNRSNKVVTVSDLDIDADGAVVNCQFSNDQPMLDRLLARRQRLLNKGLGADRASFNVLETHEPAAPTGVTQTFKIREVSDKLHFRSVITWTPVTEDVNANGTAIDHYDIQARPVNAAGAWLDEDGNVPAGSNPGYMLREVVHTKGDADAANESDTKTVFEELQRPKVWRWQARVRAVDLEGQESDWSSWTAYALPWTADPKPPAPTGLVLSWDTQERTRWSRPALIATWNEVTNFSYAGDPDSPIDDVSRYVVQMQTSDDASTVRATRTRDRAAKDADADTTNSMRFLHLRKQLYYRVRVRSIDRWNRRGDWSSFTSWTNPTDSTPPGNPSSVVAKGIFNHVLIDWAQATDAGDSEIIDKDVAYYQVQIATDAAYSSLVLFDRMVFQTRRQFETEKYLQRYWLRVRAVDASNNKSSWVSAGPVRPGRVQGVRVVAAGVPVARELNTVNEAGLELVGGLTNHAYPVSTTLDMAARIDGEEPFGILTGHVTLSPSKARAGFIFNGVDANNYLFAIVDTMHSGGPSLIVGKVSAGSVTESVINQTAGAAAVAVNGSTVEIIVDTQTTHGTIATTFNGFAVNWTLSGAEITKYQGSTGKYVGVYCSRSGSLDDGKSRFEDLMYVGETAGFETAADSFDRASSSSSLGTADSGDTWTTWTGTWGIEAVDPQTSLLGMTTTLPFMYMEDLTARTSETIPISTNNPKNMGSGGLNSGPLECWFDRPTRIIAWAASVWENEAAVAYNVRFYIGMSDDAPSTTWGRQLNNQVGASDNANGRQRLLVAMRSMFVDASPSNVIHMRFWWSYNQDDGSPRNATIKNQKMILCLVYAPDYDASAISTTRVPVWTQHGTQRRLYNNAGN